MADATLPIVLLPGLAADERLFERQRAHFPNLRVPDWIEPLADESLPGYAARLARVVDPGGPCIVGGASFGGTVALEMTRHLQAVACVLIGSLRSPLELPWRWRLLRPVMTIGPDRLGTVAAAMARWGGMMLRPGTLRRLQRLAQPESAFVRWAVCALLRWRGSSTKLPVPVFRIHGEADRTLPVQRTQSHTIVPGASHALTLFRSAAVNEFLNSVLEWSLTE
jgi:pimeloyl-ACP methyl ester carboxylesterase